jgi:hypothetical protein
VIRFGASVLAGVAATVLVSWAFAVRGVDGRHLVVSAGQSWPERPPSGWPERPERQAVGRVVGARLRMWQDLRPGDGVGWTWFREEIGWPARAMVVNERFATTATSTHEHDGAQPPRWLPFYSAVEYTVFPLRPLWFGFALDTAFYGTLAFLLWSAPGFVKRTRRRRRGLCIRCGYDLKGMPKCPECGGEQRAKGPNGQRAK